MVFDNLIVVVQSMPHCHIYGRIYLYIFEQSRSAFVRSISSEISTLQFKYAFLQFAIKFSFHQDSALLIHVLYTIHIHANHSCCVESNNTQYFLKKNVASIWFFKQLITDKLSPTIWQSSEFQYDCNSRKKHVTKRSSKNNSIMTQRKKFNNNRV